MDRTVKSAFFACLLYMAAAAQAHAGSGAQNGAPPTGCSGNPDPGVAFLWTGQNYTGTCYRLDVDNYPHTWASWDASTGFPNDTIESVKLGGGGVTLVLFWAGFWTKDNGSPLALTGWYPSLGSWNNQVSAARLQTFGFSSCFEPSGMNRTSLFTAANWGGDCTVLNTSDSGGCYGGAVAMGFRNDVLSSVINYEYSGGPAVLFTAATYQGSQKYIWPGEYYSYLGSTWNDVTSSIEFGSYQCWR